MEARKHPKLVDCCGALIHVIDWGEKIYFEKILKDHFKASKDENK